MFARKRDLRLDRSKTCGAYNFRHAARLGVATASVMAMTIAMATGTRADELAELRAQVKAMRDASVVVERRLAKLERERIVDARRSRAGVAVAGGPGSAGGANTAGGATSTRRVGSGASGAPNAGPTASPVFTQTNTPGFIQLPGLNTAIKVGGFIKIDGVYDAKGGGIGGTATDFTEIPLRGTAASRRGPDFNATARQTQLAISSVTPTPYWGDLKTFVAIDFYGATNGNGLYTNSYAPRLFQGYISLDKIAGGSLLVGQTWSTFMDLDSYPETLDLNGPLGTVFIRQPMVRYVRDLGGGSKVFLAAEAAYADFEGANPYPVFSGGGAPSSNIINPVPDFVGKYTYDAAWGHLAIAGIARYIVADTGGSIVNGFAGRSGVFGGGFMGAASIKTIGKDTINLQGVGGPGIGRYLFGEDDSGGSAASLAYCGNAAVACGLQRTTAYGAAVSYQHYWTDKLRSNFIGGFAHYDNEFPDDPAASNKNLVSAFANLIYSPVPSTDFGVEFIYGTRSVASSGVPGVSNQAEAYRFLGSAKVGF